MPAMKQGEEIFLHYKTPRLTLEPTQSPVQWVAGSFSGVKRPEREVERSHPSSAEFKNEWRYDSAPLLRLRRRDGGALLSQACSHNRDKAYHIRHVMSCPTSAIPNGRIFLNFDIEDFYENLSRNPKFSYNRALYIKTQVRFIVPTNINSPKKK